MGIEWEKAKGMMARCDKPLLFSTPPLPHWEGTGAHGNSPADTDITF